MVFVIENAVWQLRTMRGRQCISRNCSTCDCILVNYPRAIASYFAVTNTLSFNLPEFYPISLKMHALSFLTFI